MPQPIRQTETNDYCKGIIIIIFLNLESSSIQLTLLITKRVNNKHEIVDLMN